MNQNAALLNASSSPSNPNNQGTADAAGSAAASIQFIIFAIGDDQYGVDIMAVREIKGWSNVTHLPKQPEYVRGVLNLRGAIVPIVDLRCRFGHPGQAYCASLALAEWICRTADRVDSARVRGPFRRLGRGASAPDSAILRALLQRHQNAPVIA